MTSQQRANVMLRLRQMHPHLSVVQLDHLLAGVDRARASDSLTRLATPAMRCPPRPANSNLANDDVIGHALMAGVRRAMEEAPCRPL
ncbi:hypothetical protein [Rhodopseudomonas sp.]|uniref:hypothetical protein n=1 Tax=Rhodopseudomonas sp. TaxID=1078 RepID=UPI003B3A4757